MDSSEVNHVTRLQKQAQLVELAFVIKTVVSGMWVAKCSVSLDAALHVSPSQSSELMRLLKNGPVLVLVLVRCLMLVVRRVG